MKGFAYLEALMNERDTRYQQRFEAQSSAIASALLAAKEAVTKAETATERRFESVNEFRGALDDSAKNLITRPEVEAWREQIREMLTALSARISLMEGALKGGKDVWAYVAALVGVLIGIVGAIMAIMNFPRSM